MTGIGFGSRPPRGTAEKEANCTDFLHFARKPPFCKKMLNRAELHIKRLDLNQRLEEFGNDLLLFTGTFGRFK